MVYLLLLSYFPNVSIDDTFDHSYDSSVFFFFSTLWQKGRIDFNVILEFLVRVAYTLLMETSK